MSADTSAPPRPSAVLDDDPTGPQLLRDTPVLLAWSPAEVAAALAGRRSVHLVTNTRALPASEAAALTRSAAAAARAGVPGCRLVLRGDSTLRGHLLEEYDAVREVAFPGVDPVLLLVPAMPSAGRVTRDGVHYVVRDGALVPLDRTEYAVDGPFAYRSSRLLEYADERSGGRFRTADGVEVALARLSAEGPRAVEEALATAARRGGAVVAVDAVDATHLATILAGLEAAEARGVPVVVRCSPGFAAVLAGTPEGALVELPATPGGVLVVCGSYVPGTTRQLARLVARTRAELVDVDVARLASPDPGPEVARLATEAGRRLAADGVAVLATPRVRPPGLADLASGARIAEHLARAAGAVRPAPSVVVTKGGITSAVTLHSGFGVRSATVLGPVAAGVSRWRAAAGGPEFLVFPGNVGGDEALADLVEALHPAPAPSGNG